MGNGFYADADKIAGQKRFHQYETRLAGELLAGVQALAQHPGIQADDRYRLIVGEAKTLQDYFRKMQDFTEAFSDQILETSKKMDHMLTQAADRPPAGATIDLD